jgi:HK97 family phage major capsid protein
MPDTINDDIIVLRKSLGDKATAMNFIADKAKNEKRSLTDDEQKDINKLIDEQEAIDKEIKTLERMTRSQIAVSETENRTADVSQDKRGIEYADDSPYTFGEYLRDVALDAMSTRKRVSDYKLPRRLELHQRKAEQEFRAYSGMNETIGSEGGFLVGTDFASTVFQKVHANGTLAGRCRQGTISNNSNSVSIPTVDETTRATGSRLGGVLAYWEAEGGTPTAGKLAWGRINIALNKLFATAYCTEDLIMDAGYLQTVIGQGLQDEVSFMVQDAIVRGDGAGKPLGYLNANCKVSITKETGQEADTICAENVLKMYTAMHTSGKQNFVWVANDEIIPQLVLLQSDRFPNVTFFVTAGGLINSPTDTLLGKPIVYVEQAPALGDEGDISACDFSQYQIINKGNPQLATSAHVAFLTDEMVFKLTFRVGGQPLWKSALTPYKGAQDRSPFVVLGARE